MKCIVAGGTDAGSMLLFDPAALPADYNWVGAAESHFEELTQNGDAVWFNFCSDGGYDLHAFVDEEISPELTGSLSEEVHVPCFRVPSGNLCFTGIEDSFKHDDSKLQKYHDLGCACELPPGRYSLSAFQMDYPEEMMEDQLRERVTPGAFRLHDNFAVFVMGFWIGLGCLALSYRKPNLRPYLLPVGICLTALPFLVARLPIYRNTARIWNEIQSRYPAIVVTLKCIEAVSGEADIQSSGDPA